MKNILVATDGSESAQRAVEAAADLAAANKAKLTIINVQDARPLGDAGERFAEVELPKALESRGYDLPDYIRANLQRFAPGEVFEQHSRQTAFLRECISDSILAHADRTARDAGVAELETVSATGDAAEEIVSAAKRIGADLVVLGRRGLGSIAELLLGSVSQKVLHRANANVLTVV